MLQHVRNEPLSLGQHPEKSVFSDFIQKICEGHDVFRMAARYKLASNLDTYQGVWHHTDGMPPSEAPGNIFLVCIKHQITQTACRLMRPPVIGLR
jgi:hypothetical protein